MKNFIRISVLILTFTAISQISAVQRVYEDYYDKPVYYDRYDHGVVGTPVVAAADATDDVLGGLFGGPRRERRYYYYN